jgi:hypothetical protein
MSASGRRARANAELLTELHGLRAALRQMTDAFEVAVGGRLADAIGRLEGDAALDQAPRLLTAGAAEDLIAAIRAVRLRPERGRIRDFKRLEALAQRIAEAMD